ncbi:hypothetical protein DVH05_019526 [Phytophthora capsici]|nr:hypothetical protein DVH05_019526 [Phytophthora capsici]
MTEAEGESRTEAASDGGIEGVLEQMRLGVSEEDSLRAAVYVATVRPAQASQRYNYKRRSSEAAADSEAVIREEERFLSEDLQTGEGEDGDAMSTVGCLTPRFTM